LEFISKNGRLDKVLQASINTTRNQISNFIRSGNVKVDGKIVKDLQ